MQLKVRLLETQKHVATLRSALRDPFPGLWKGKDGMQET